MNAASERPYSVNSLSDVGIEVTDEDLKKLADSFAKGRDELQKVKIFLTNLFSLDLIIIYIHALT